MYYRDGVGSIRENSLDFHQILSLPKLFFSANV